MSKDTVSITITGDANDAIKEYDRLAKAQRATTAEVDRAKQASKEAAAEDRKYSAIARKAMQDTETAAEAATRKRNELNQAYKRGKIDLVTYDRAMRRLDTTQSRGRQTSGKLTGSISEMKAAMMGGSGVAGSFTAGLSKIGPAGVAAAAAITALVSAAKQGIQDAKNFDVQEAGTSATIDRSASRIIRQSGRGEEDRESITNAMLDIADETAYDVGKTAQVIESGYSVGLGNVDQNGIAQEVITGIQAMNLEDSDPTEVIETVAQLLKSFKLDLNRENVRDVMQRIHGEFGEGVIQLSDLNRLSENAPMLAMTGEKFDSSLALQASFQEVAAPEKVRTGLQNYMGAVEVDIGTQDKKRQQVEALGLSPEDLKLGDQSVAESMQKLGDAMDAASYTVDQKAETMGVLFGRENASTIVSMVDQVRSGDYNKRLAMQQDTGKYDAGVESVRSDLMAGKTRLEISQVRTDIADAAQASKNIAVSQQIKQNYQQAHQTVGDDNMLSKAVVYGSSFIPAGLDYVGMGDEYLALRDQVTGGDQMGKIDKSYGGEPTEALSLSPDAFSQQLTGVSVTPFGVMENLVDSMNQLRDSMDRSSANNTAPKGVLREEAPDFQPVIKRDPMSVALGGAFGGGM